MRRPPAYNLYSSSYNPGWRDHSSFSYLQDFQQNETVAQVSQAPQPAFRHLTRISYNLNHWKSNSKAIKIYRGCYGRTKKRGDWKCFNNSAKIVSHNMGLSNKIHWPH